MKQYGYMPYLDEGVLCRITLCCLQMQRCTQACEWGGGDSQRARSCVEGTLDMAPLIWLQQH